MVGQGWLDRAGGQKVKKCSSQGEGGTLTGAALLYLLLDLIQAVFLRNAYIFEREMDLQYFISPVFPE